ncbi:DUF2797 domain-containing protein [Candidatus Saccharibacteria bacterium]|nr:DUF2797 domain-containing protein [Candidatus Saccharibacteria bacterium]
MSSNSVLTYNLFTRVSYRDNNGLIRPHLLYGDQVFNPLGKTFTLSFDTSIRYCLGWHDLATSTSHPCPSSATTDQKYDTCAACQKRTGFNPAFYHAATVSKQQEQLNQEPHILYLAHFGDTYLKVGISRKKRKLQRLYEQGARTALILDTFPTAIVARQYEAQIARLPNMHETTAVRTKRAFLEQPYSAAAAAKLLTNTCRQIESKLNLSFSTTSPQSFDNVYFAHGYQAQPFTALPNSSQISGTCLGVVGDILLMQHDDHRLALPLKQLYGYPLTVANTVTSLSLPPQQASLF